MKSISFIYIMVTILMCSQSFAKVYRGKENGKDFKITVSKGTNLIKGNWGKKQIKLEVNKFFQDIEGEIGGKKVDLDFSSTFKYVKGQLPCGRVDFDYKQKHHYIGGIVCGDKFEIDLDQTKKVNVKASELYLDELLESFPEAVKSDLRKFIDARIKL